ncbi:phospholipase A2-like [Pollicipes pollicipes]|uniref:phospholipase A2-like n=1 Tax=Pollicipes pollicipes TaxID=41117 RepID=UPI001885A27A|nr:phospholipase A2-like [Pollicipes pollicipes]
MSKGALLLLALQLIITASSEIIVTRSVIDGLCQRMSLSRGHRICDRLSRRRRSADVSAFVSDAAIDNLMKSTMPGTKWCGAGSAATSYDDLGPAEATDRCCRDHDHCPLWLAAGQTSRGATNTMPYTASSCRCDASFFRCLRRAHSPASQLVGELFFNVLHPKCLVTVRNARQVAPPRLEDERHPGEDRSESGKDCNERNEDFNGPDEWGRLALVESSLQGQYPDLPKHDTQLARNAEDMAAQMLDLLIQGQEP